MQGDVIDYMGNTAHYHELSGVHLSNAPYQMSMAKEFIEYITELRLMQGVGYE